MEPLVETATPSEFHERRYHVQIGPPTFACRVCWVRTTVTAGGVELHGGRAYHRCPECDGASLIREDDVDLLRATP
ncbi:MAG: hypothetical protein ABJD24_18770 [Acidimicrobiales bacterium]